MNPLLRVLAAAAATVAVATGTASAQLTIPIPGMSTGPTLDVRPNSATVQFTMVPTVIPGRAYIQYGTTPALGQQSAAYPIVPGDQPTTGTIELTGLAPETTYTYRAYLENDASFRSTGTPLTFTTAAAPAAPPTRGGEPDGGAGGGPGGGGPTGRGAPAPPACAARGARAVTTGAAALTLDRALVGGFGRARYRLGATRPARLAGRAWTLPLSGGALDGRLRTGQLCAAGGLSLRGGRATVAIGAVTLRLAARRPQLSARVGRRTVALATLGPVALAGRGATRSATRVRATLTAAGASALRTALGTRDPRAGALLGTLALRLRVA